jgi:hypothetical protein
MKAVYLLAAIGACSMTAYAGITQDILVDFDDQAGGIPPIETDGTFSDHVTFSTSDNNILMIFEGAGFVGGSSPNILTAGISTTTDNFNADIYMDFSVAANNVSLDVVSDNDSGAVAMLGVFHSGGFTELNVVGNGNFTDAIHMDLSSYSDVTRVELFGITDEFGLGIDNLALTVPVPAPATLAILGLSGLASSRRRR